MIIGITGRKRHGKDSVANILVHNSDNKIFHFADKLKETVRYLYNLPDDVDKEDVTNICSDRFPKIFGDRPHFFLTYRDLLKTVGSDMMREVDKDIWVKALFGDRQFVLDLALAKDQIIADVRFDNEVEAIKAKGGVIVKVVRTNIREEEHDDHKTEKGVSNHLIDYTVLNSSSLEDLTHVVEFLKETMKGKGEDR